MGTNFYLKHIPTAQEYEAMQESLQAKELEKLQEQIQEAMRKYHIGKRSFGWAFLFQAKSPGYNYDENDVSKAPWEANIESLKSFVNDTEHYQIVNEYGETFTPEQFWDEEVGEALTVHDKYLSHAEWNVLHPTEAIHDSNEWVDKKIRWCNCYFA